MREAQPFDLDPSEPPDDALLALNNRHATELSYLDAAGFRSRVQAAYRAWRIEPAAALLIAFDEAAAYDNANFRWFRARYERFIYVDRIVVDPAARGRGYARTLYEQLFRVAAQTGHERVMCEVNSSPPNTVSDAFHRSLGFIEVGSADIHGGAKTVRYLKREL